MKPIKAPPPTRLEPPARARETLIRLVSDLLRMPWQRVDARHYLDDYQASQWLPPTPLRELQLAKLRRLVWHCFLHVPWYAARIRLPPSRLERLDGLAELPAVSADERRDEAPFVATTFEPVAAERRTAGTRGKPARVILDGAALERRLAVRLRAERWAGAPPGRLFSPWPWDRELRVAHVPAASELDKLHAELVRARGAVVMGPGPALDALARVIEGAPRPSRWRALVRGAEAQVRGVVVTGPDTASGGGARLAGLTGARLSRWYVCAEVGLIAATCDRAPSEAALHVQADHLLVEVLGDGGAPLAPGAVGRLHVTDLHNYAAPYLRQDLGDRGRLLPHPCACGRALPLLELQ
ncbi:MAG TPA: hypothetical protein VII38_18000 [Polyangia bacterium]|jgi:phenylacetate-CoA ligase